MIKDKERKGSYVCYKSAESDSYDPIFIITNFQGLKTDEPLYSYKEN